MKRLIAILTMSFFIVAVGGGSSLVGSRQADIYQKLDAVALFKKGNLAMKNSGKTDSATFYFTAAAYRYDPDDIPEEQLRACVASYTNLGYIYFYHFNEYQKAYDNITAAMEISGKYDFHQFDPHNLLNLGQLYILYWDFYQQSKYRDMALGEFHKAFLTARNIGDYEYMTLTFLAMAHNLLDGGWPDYFHEDMKAFRSARIPPATPLYSYALLIADALENYNSGNITAAEHAMRQAYAINGISDDKRVKLLAGLHLVKFQILTRSSNNDSILKSLERICNDRTYVDLSIDVYRRLSDNYFKAGDSVSGLRYRLKYLERKDSLLTKSNVGTITHMGLQKEIEHMQRDMMHERDAHRVMTGIFVMVIGIMIIVIILGINVLYNKKKLAAKNLILYRQAQERLKIMDTIPGIASPVDGSTPTDDKYRNSSLRDEHKQEILSKINTFIENNPAVYGDNFLIADLAAAIGERVPHISQVINETYNKNFRSYLNELRIRMACMMLEDNENTKYTIEAIAGKLGFKSRSNFMMNFKKVMGLTPSEYRKIHNSNPTGKDRSELV